MMKTTVEQIVSQSQAVCHFAEINLKALSKVVPKEDQVGEEEFSYIIGLIRRQIILTTDIGILFASKAHSSYISSYILCRCILDDYITLTYVFNSDDIRSKIIQCNSGAWDQNFKKMEFLADVNEKYLSGNAPYYPTYAMMEKYKSEFIANPAFKEYFKDVHYPTDKNGNLMLKKFLTTRQMIENVPDNEFASFVRIYYLWGHFSTYTHYSTLSFQNELHESSNCNNFVNEAIYYSYRVILLSLEYFASRYKMEIVDDDDLAFHYSRAEEL